ncbi:hypothetical protein [Streptomyces sp. NPDC003077]|uniref:hypothetical protein n=1 Tax=Streptomyces sp. NPDC003077 TaxID=3154443 RepID=UPI0033BC29EC
MSAGAERPRPTAGPEGARQKHGTAPPVGVAAGADPRKEAGNTAGTSAGESAEAEGRGNGSAHGGDGGAGRDRAGKDSAGEDSAGEDSTGKDSTGKDSAGSADAAGQGATDADGFDDPDFDDWAEGPGTGGWQRHHVIYAPHGNINTGAVLGGQHVRNQGPAGGPGDRRVEAHEGPIPAMEIVDARFGFAEPEWFPAALTALDSRVLFLTGAPGTGRRTAALNLLYRHSGDSLELRALDSSGPDLASWRPGRGEARGYLVDGLLPPYPLNPGAVGNLRRLLHEADARMVIVLPDDPELVRRLGRDLHVEPVRCEPPSPHAVFDARFAATVPDPAERDRLLAGLEPGLLDDLLVPELVPAEVAELVAAIAASGDDGTGLSDIRDRLSFLAEGEVPDLLTKLHDDADGLAFLLAACVFEGLDHRIVREEADRLLELADGRLHSVLPQGGDPADQDGGGGGGRREAPRPNPAFVFRRSLDDLLHTVRARRAPREIRTGAGYAYAVEAVWFTRHRQAEAVLRYVWREYGRLSDVLTTWMDEVANQKDLTQRVGRVMGMAAGWGGGRRALQHITALAGSERWTSRTIAAQALGVAAADPVLASEVKERLRVWSHAADERLRSTVAYTCGTEFGLSRPDLAMELLRRLAFGLDTERHTTVERAVRSALRDLFSAGRRSLVFRHLVDWAGREGGHARLALTVFPRLLWDATWFQGELTGGGDTAGQIVDLIRRTLDDEETFAATRDSLLAWCRSATWDERQRAAVESLLTVLAHPLGPGVLGLFVAIDRDENPDLVGRYIARSALDTWRRGETVPPPSATHGDPAAYERTS